MDPPWILPGFSLDSLLGRGSLEHSSRDGDGLQGWRSSREGQSWGRLLCREGLQELLCCFPWSCSIHGIHRIHGISSSQLRSVWDGPKAPPGKEGAGTGAAWNKGVDSPDLCGTGGSGAFPESSREGTLSPGELVLPWQCQARGRHSPGVPGLGFQPEQRRQGREQPPARLPRCFQECLCPLGHGRDTNQALMESAWHRDGTECPGTGRGQAGAAWDPGTGPEPGSAGAAARSRGWDMDPSRQEGALQLPPCPPVCPCLAQGCGKGSSSGMRGFGIQLWECSFPPALSRGCH